MQRVFLVPHDPRWREEFARESANVASALGDVLVAIYHMRSTAIPGIRAKPIIDMLVPVTQLSAVDEGSQRLVALGYESMGEFGIAGRRYFRKEDNRSTRTHQIHAFEVGSPQIERHLAFRDFMRIHPDDAQRYDALKCRLAELYSADLASYSEGKDEFIKAIDVKAASWRSALKTQGKLGLVSSDR